jgi:hypothetical protein
MVSKSAVIGGQTFVVNCSDRVESQAQWVIDLLRRLHEQGIELGEGKSVQLGWSALRFSRRADDKAILVCEPDFDRNPFADIRPNVTCTLTILAKQKDLAARLRVDPVEISFQDKIVLKRGVLSRQRVYLERKPSPRKGDSGWYIGPVEADGIQPKAEELEAMYVYQLLAVRPEMLTALILPTGYLVVMNGSELEAVLDPHNVDVLAPATGVL